MLNCSSIKLPKDLTHNTAGLFNTIFQKVGDVFGFFSFLEGRVGVVDFVDLFDGSRVESIHYFAQNTSVLQDSANVILN